MEWAAATRHAFPSVLRRREDSQSPAASAASPATSRSRALLRSNSGSATRTGAPPSPMCRHVPSLKTLAYSHITPTVSVDVQGASKPSIPLLLLHGMFLISSQELMLLDDISKFSERQFQDCQNGTSQRSLFGDRTPLAHLMRATMPCMRCLQVVFTARDRNRFIRKSACKDRLFQQTRQEPRCLQIQEGT